MRATHINFQHPGHLRVIDGQTHRAWNFTVGWYDTDAVCMAPSHSQFSKLNRPGLPCFESNLPPAQCPHCIERAKRKDAR